MTDPETFTFADDGTIPNSRLPLLVYRRAVPADADAIEVRFAENHWPPAWRDGVFPYHHFHPNAHEALGVARGEATVLFGGPGGRALAVQAGDVVVIPAGVGHCRQSASPDLLIVGAYPSNAESPETLRAEPARHEEAIKRSSRMSLPESDPVSGPTGPLSRIWST